MPGKAETIALESFSSASDIQRGIRLITKPLEAMGFLFSHSEEDLPLRILSVCNFYPAVMQLYCKSLVDRLMNRRQDAKPPLYITADDLDAVENDSSLLSELRHKFELNLNLDKRYKEIALPLADVYYSQSASGPYAGLTISEICDLCETLVPAHFANAGPGVYEALLEEMIKLNVLERVNTRYVLRNPNIAMMMGDADRVAHKLDELAEEPPEETRNRGERRVTMDHSTSGISFPLPVAWVRRRTNPCYDEHAHGCVRVRHLRPEITLGLRLFQRKQGGRHPTFGAQGQRGAEMSCAPRKRQPARPQPLRRAKGEPVSVQQAGACEVSSGVR